MHETMRQMARQSQGAEVAPAVPTPATTGIAAADAWLANIFDARTALATHVRYPGLLLLAETRGPIA